VASAAFTLAIVRVFVSAEAESVRYRFAPGLKDRAERTRGNEECVASVNAIAAWALCVFQACFGCMLIVSLSIVLLCLAAVATAAIVAMQQQQAQRRGGGRGGVGGLFSALGSSRFGSGWNLLRLWNEISMLYWIFGGRNPFFQPLPSFWSPLGMVLWSSRTGRRFAGSPRRWSNETHFSPRAPPPAPATRVHMRDGVAVAVPVAVPVAARVASDWAEPTEPLLAGEEQPPQLLQSIHSFVFGDEHASSDARSHWKTVGRFLVSKQCSVAAEELFPFLQAPPPAGLAAPPRVVAPILQHFRGTFRQSPGGGIRCDFKELAGPDSARALGDGAAAAMLVELPCAFTAKPVEHMRVAAGLGVANLLGVLWLRSQLKFGGLGGPVAPVLRAASSFLLAYACAYLALPAARWSLLQVANARVNRRNALRKAMATELSAMR
jgi:hypothetical protein